MEFAGEGSVINGLPRPVLKNRKEGLTAPVGGAVAPSAAVWSEGIIRYQTKLSQAAVFSLSSAEKQRYRGEVEDYWRSRDKGRMKQSSRDTGRS